MVPKDKETHLGIEIEFYSNIPRFDTQNLLARTLKSKYWEYQIGTDGSVRCDCFSPDGLCLCRDYELRILVKRKYLRLLMIKLDEALKAVNAKVNKTCGLHVHLDARNKTDEQLSRLFNNLVRSQDLFFSLANKTRRNNIYCQKNSYKPNTKFTDTLIQTEQRRMAINAQAFLKHRTIEIRLHHGSNNAKEIIGWAELVSRVGYGRELKTKLKTVNDLKMTPYVTTVVKEYLKIRKAA